MSKEPSQLDKQLDKLEGDARAGIRREMWMRRPDPPLTLSSSQLLALVQCAKILAALDSDSKTDYRKSFVIHVRESIWALEAALGNTQEPPT